MPPIDRARRLSRSLQARFRIDLFSVLVEREFERRLAEAIVAAERDAFLRGWEAARTGAAAGPHGDGHHASGANDAMTPSARNGRSHENPVPAA